MAARAAGMGFVAVLSGTTGGEVFAKYPARGVLGGVGEIVVPSNHSGARRPP